MGNSSSRPPSYSNSTKETPTNKTSSWPYSALESELRSTCKEGRFLKHKDSPQWRWSNAPCRIWIFLFLTRRCQWGERRSYEKAIEFTGLGPTLFQLNQDEWEKMLGDRMIAMAICAVIYESRLSGFVPSSVKFEHWKVYKGQKKETVRLRWAY